jgi:hypothetical protein
MKNLVFILFLGACAFTIFGYFLGWYKISDFGSDNGHRRVQIDLDSKKIKEDLQKGQSRLNDALQKGQDSLPQPEVKPQDPLVNTQTANAKPVQSPELILVEPFER